MKAEQKYQEALKDGQIKELLTEQGLPEFIIEDGLDVKEYAILAKAHLENEKLIAHDFISHVYNQSRTASATFEYQSGWPLEGLAEGELE